ncbi:MAG TPA: DUF1501 domain-containing protein [Povalibacter sp.]
MSNVDISRRNFLQAAALGACMPRFVLAAEADTQSRFVLVILRGALDGLAAVPAYGDGSYASKRGALAITAPQFRLDGLFALNPGLPHLYERYQAKELIVFHAVASPYRERSHFDGQNLLENGSSQAGLARDGWLNRAIAVMPAARVRTSEEVAVALAQNLPLVLRGDTRVNSWAPSRLPQTDSDTLQRIEDLYSTEPYFAERLHAALTANEVVGSSMVASNRDPLGQFGQIASAAGRMLAPDNGARIAVIEASGWDTHANQGAEQGPLMNRLRALDAGLDTLRTTLGPVWNKTAVMVVTEFGRTVAVNGTRGTDHGTATCAFLLGGAVSGGKVVADWPGLATASLYQSRDLRPTLDLRSVFKGVLAEHLYASESSLESRVFPGSASARPAEGLIRRS